MLEIGRVSTSEEFGWVISSDLPIGQGLKSSSALANAAFRALNNGSWTAYLIRILPIYQLQLKESPKCTVTGSMGDTWLLKGLEISRPDTWFL